MDDNVRDEVNVTSNDVEGGHGVKKGDMKTWKNKKNEWVQSMWLHRNDVYS
jgi:hypothetical protein